MVVSNESWSEYQVLEGSEKHTSSQIPLDRSFEPAYKLAQVNDVDASIFSHGTANSLTHDDI